MAKKARPFEVTSAPYTHPAENEIVVKNFARGVNPVDRGLQETAPPSIPLNSPAILGFDVAGEVVEVGGLVSRFKKGDRVVGQAAGVVGKKPCYDGNSVVKLAGEKIAFSG